MALRRSLSATSVLPVQPSRRGAESRNVPPISTSTPSSYTLAVTPPASILGTSARDGVVVVDGDDDALAVQLPRPVAKGFTTLSQLAGDRRNLEPKKPLGVPRQDRLLLPIEKKWAFIGDRLSSALPVV